jgi:hypothetical protein
MFAIELTEIQHKALLIYLNRVTLTASEIHSFMDVMKQVTSAKPIEQPKTNEQPAG